MAYTTIDDPSLYFNTVLYTGNGGTNAITGVGFQPDWVSIKRRSGSASNGGVFDVLRGVTKLLSTSLNDVEETRTDSLTAFGTDGFTLGADTGNYVNTNSETFVSWNWKAGGSGSSNSDGGTSSSVSANTTAGFSIVSWTGSSSASVQTIGHGLGTTPHWILSKNRGSGSSITAWVNYHHKIDASAPEDYTIYLNNTDARVNNPVFGDTAPTSTVFSFNTGTDDQNYISYCFAEKKGFSKFGSYTANAAGPFIYTGFRPAWVMIKRTDSTQQWGIVDSKRDVHNPAQHHLFAESSQAEGGASSYNNFDLLSNGIKMRSTDQWTNASGGSYIYMAFAESPFVNSNGVPNNAR